MIFLRSFKQQILHHSIFVNSNLHLTQKLLAFLNFNWTSFHLLRPDSRQHIVPCNLNWFVSHILSMNSINVILIGNNTYFDQIVLQTQKLVCHHNTVLVRLNHPDFKMLSFLNHYRLDSHVSCIEILIISKQIVFVFKSVNSWSLGSLLFSFLDWVSRVSHFSRIKL